MQPTHFRDTSNVQLMNRKCKNCAHAIGYASPRIDQIPLELRCLSPDLIGVLAPLIIDVGPEQRHAHGYRVHLKMCTFQWKSYTVEHAISQYKGRDLEKLQRAFDMLMHRECSAYQTFVYKHYAFLEKSFQKTSVVPKKFTSWIH